ncbi:MAG: D-alanyl-D-alanine carboxypeptidase family protein [Xanthobacteraceae bacterium]
MSDSPRSPHWTVWVGLLAALMLAGAATDGQARPARKHTPAPQAAAVEQPSGFQPKRYADIVVDDKSGEVLHDTNADLLCHPASLTKIMTLYLLFEQIEAGHLKLDTPLPVSAHAAIQRPTKLGLKVNQTITVEEAIKGLVTRSANDAAVVIAEAIAGSEEAFGRLMTVRAAMLGMASTTYINASGLPAEQQVTTARDQALLGRAIQHRFPQLYPYFATPSFKYRGVEIRNHNGLLGNVKGVDGIKTGYTDASGYNLVSSVRRDDKHIVAVVLGGKSNAARDTRMRQLIEAHIGQANGERTAPVVGEARFEDPTQGEVIMPALLTAPPGSEAVAPSLASVGSETIQARAAVNPQGSKPPGKPSRRMRQQ